MLQSSTASRLKLVTRLAKLHPSNTSRISLYASKYFTKIDTFQRELILKKVSMRYLTFNCNKGNDPEIGKGN